MEETKKKLIDSLRRFRGTLTFDVLDEEQGLIYLYTGEERGITLQIVQRGKKDVPIVAYLRLQTGSWIDHDTLRLDFSEEEIWEAMRTGYLKPMKQLHCYSIETDKLG